MYCKNKPASNNYGVMIPTDSSKFKTKITVMTGNNRVYFLEKFSILSQLGQQIALHPLML